MLKSIKSKQEWMLNHLSSHNRRNTCYPRPATFAKAKFGDVLEQPNPSCFFVQTL